MSNLPKEAVSPKSLSAVDQTVQTKAQEGEWMYLADAARATGMSERTLRRHLKKNALRSKRLGKLANSPLQVWITPEFKADPEEEIATEIADVDFFDAVEEDSDFSQEENDEAVPSQQKQGFDASIELEKVVKAIAEQFGNKLDEQKEVIFQLRHELQEKETQLRLLPDLQKKLEEEEKLKDFETSALKKQIEELNKENAELKETAESLKKAASEKKSMWSWFTGK